MAAKTSTAATTPAKADTSKKMTWKERYDAMTGYQTFSFYDGLLYRFMSLAMLVVMFCFRYFMGGEGTLGQIFDSTGFISSLFFVVASAVGIPYYYGSMYHRDSLIDLTVLWRITYVFAGILLTYVVGQEISGLNYFIILTAFFIDVVGGTIQGMWLAPGQLCGCFHRVWDHMFHVIEPAKNRWVHVEGFLGILLAVMATVFTAFTDLQPDEEVAASNTEAAIEGMGCVWKHLLSAPACKPNTELACFAVSIPGLFYMFMMWVAKDNNSTSCWVLGLNRAAMLGPVFYNIFRNDFCVLPHQVYLFTMVSGILSPKLGVLSNSLGLLFYYFRGFLISVGQGPTGILVWVAMWSIITEAVSLLWIWIFWTTYDEKQQKRISGTARQDLLLCLFSVAVAGVLHKQGKLFMDFSTMTLGNAFSVDNAGFTVGTFVPLGVLWFTLETKFMTHVWVNSPYHASWWGHFPIGERHRFAPKNFEAVNWSFGFVGAAMTLIVVMYAVFLIVEALGSWIALTHPINVGGQDLALWKYIGTHGIFCILATGSWMIIASSGIPGWVVYGEKFYVPPDVPPVHQCNPHDCKVVHVPDLVFGHFLMFYATLRGDDSVTMQDSTSTEVKGMHTLILLYWCLSIVAKLYVHYRAEHWGEDHDMKYVVGGRADPRDLIERIREALGYESDKKYYYPANEAKKNA